MSKTRLVCAPMSYFSGIADASRPYCDPTRVIPPQPSMTPTENTDPRGTYPDSHAFRASPDCATHIFILRAFQYIFVSASTEIPTRACGQAPGRRTLALSPTSHYPSIRNVSPIPAYMRAVSRITNCLHARSAGAPLTARATCHRLSLVERTL
ncbi:hypothetical protein C8R43DRAFT_1230738 [Mycena crocata]|nr:hypothetical protein C8R43DRAFT_1230738 [Mycena crocata]